MDTNDEIEQPACRPGIELTLEAQGYLVEAGKWAYFLSIIGFIICGLFLLAAIFAGSLFTRVAQMQPENTTAALMAGAGGFVTFFYILIDVIYFFFSLYLYQFGSKIKQGIKFSDSDYVSRALGKLKSFFKLWGIITIVVVTIYVLIFFIVIVVGIGAATLLHK
jgi:hypothetical protein